LAFRVFSLKPHKGYEAPVLAGHRDGIVAVYFSSEAMQKVAQVEGKDIPLLYTVSKDGALFSWHFTPKPRGTAAGGGEPEAEEPAFDSPLDFPFLASKNFLSCQ
jgi:periodic tryptophan protein 2